MKHIKIYQILGNDDTSRDAKFSHYDGSVNSSLYEKVFDCEIEEEDLEDIFYRFNTSRHPLFFGHSLSVSDIVIKDGAAHYCDSYGWKHGIPFDETATKESKLDMRVIFVAPTMKPTVAYMPNSLKAKQQAVGGYGRNEFHFAAVLRLIQFHFGFRCSSVIQDYCSKTKCHSDTFLS